jgi:glycosyltransferase involved in cell wall biosynthesis
VYNLWQEETVKEQPSTVLFFGRISPYKGLEYLIKAEPLIARQVPDLKIIIAGEGDLSPYAAMMQNRDRYEIHNSYVSKELAAELFQRATCIVLPYIDATQSAVLMTAYAFGKPAVVTRVGGLAEIVEEAVNGLLVPPANVAALAEAVTRLLSNNVLKERMKDNIKNHLKEELSWERIAQETSAIYEQALGDRIPRA